ncbi:MAG: Calx-beta domain-containing protein, partial [Pseudohongiellaceae bacterium]
LALDRVPTLPVSVNYATRGRTLPLNPSDPPLAISEQDFVATAGSLQFAAGSAIETVTITVALIDDDIPGEGDERFYLEFSDARNLAAVSRLTGIITDNDDDKIVISIAADTTTVTEGNEAVFILTASSSGHSAALVIGVDLSQEGMYLVPGAATNVSVTIGTGESTATLRVATEGKTVGTGTDEVDGSITATIQTSTNYTAAAEPDNSATVQVLDDDISALSISVVDVAGSRIEEGELAVFVVTAPFVQSSDLTVRIGVSESGDVIDAALLPSVAVILAGDSTALFRVSTINDSDDEPSSTITATIAMHADYTINVASAEIEVTARDIPPVTIPVDGAGLRIADVSGSEAIGTMPFTVTLTPADASTTMTVTVDYATSDDSALAGSDYTATSGTLTFVTTPSTVVTMTAGGTTTTMEVNPPVTATISVPITSDNENEDNERFFVVLSNPMPDTVPLPSRPGTGTIIDTNKRIVGIARPVGEIEEGGGAVFRFTVNRAPDFGNDLIINLLAPEDPGGYLTEAAPTTVTIAALQHSAALTLATANDDVIEADSYIGWTIGQSASYPYVTRTGETSATVRVTSEDRATLAISEVASSVAEGAPAEFEVTATGTLSATAVLNVGLLVSEQGDFIDGSSATLTSVSGGSGGYGASLSLSTGNLTAILTVATLDDDVDEADGNITATLQTGNLYTLSTVTADNSAGVSVTDDDLPSLSLAGATTTEGTDATLEFVLTLSGPTDEVITIEANTSDGTATTADGDYTAISAQQVSFAVGQTRQIITVAVLNDEVAEATTESLYLVLSNPMPSGLTLTNSQARGDIRDDDTPIISIAPVTTPVTEGTAAVFRLTPSVTRPNQILLPVEVSQVGDYRTPGAAARLSLRLLPNQSEALLTVTTTADSIDENHGNITATLFTGPNYRVAAEPNNIATIVIEDDDDPSISIRPVADSITESDPPTPALFTITATSMQDTALTVGVSIVEANGSFTVPPLPTMAVIADGQSSVVLTVATRADNGVSNPDSIITATVLTGTGYQTGAPVSAEVFVRDGNRPPDPTQRPVVNVGTVAPASVDEHAGVIRFGISLSRETLLTVRVAYQTSDGTATAPADYEAQIDSLVFNPGGGLSQTVTVAIVDDALDEDDETLLLNILSATNASIGAAITDGMIVDNDDTVSISTATTTVSEADSSSSPPQFTLTASAVQPTDLTVTVSVDNGPGNDFLQGTPPLLVTVTIPASSASSEFTLTSALDDDDIPEADGSIIVTVLNDARYNPAPAPDNSVSVSVTDDD